MSRYRLKLTEVNGSMVGFAKWRLRRMVNGGCAVWLKRRVNGSIDALIISYLVPTTIHPEDGLPISSHPVTVEPLQSQAPTRPAATFWKRMSLLPSLL